MELYIIIDENNIVQTVGTSPIGENPILIETEDLRILEFPNAYTYVNGEVVKDTQRYQQLLLDLQNELTIPSNEQRIEQLENVILMLMTMMM